MDTKDLELLTQLNMDGRQGPSSLSSALGITEGNVLRRMKLLTTEGVLSGFSAFLDRRSFGYMTTFLKLHYRGGDLERALEGILELPEIALVYPNMDDFMMVEVVHYDIDTLRSVVRALERVVNPFTVTAHYGPRLPDEVPPPPPKRWSGLLSELIMNGRSTYEELSTKCGMDLGEVKDAMEMMAKNGTMKVKPLVRDDLISPYPAFSILILLSPSCELSGCYGEIMHMSKEAWDSVPLTEPQGIWLRCFGRDLHGMDSMLEKYRRLPYVQDVKVVLPDSIVQRREVDVAMVRGHYGVRTRGSLISRGSPKRASRNR
ncbi:MAG: Lrp/AsnC family transcriptional regulator [Candidatus Thermoplasmatota archaeon]|jgi:DNA-binding Lrp family transcriptional regulator|nr:Lrp/AsnC family transcriptional regulator [Candidatus Thermoplasmatota archaeon]